MSNRRSLLPRFAHRAVLGALGAVAVLIAATPLTAARPPSLIPIEFVVIVHVDNPVTSMDRDQLSRIFLKRVTEWSDKFVVLPVDLPSQDERRVRFTKIVHRKSISAIRAFWQQQIFSGRDVPPPEKENESDVVSFVKENLGAIGYVSGTQVPPGVKVLAIEDIQK